NENTSEQARSKGGSEGSTHPTKDPLVPSEDPLLSLTIRFESFHSALEGSPEHNSVATWEHVKTHSNHRVIDFRLRQQHRELALDRHQLAIANQFASAQPSTVHDEGLGESCKLARSCECDSTNAPPGDVEIAH